MLKYILVLHVRCFFVIILLEVFGHESGRGKAMKNLSLLVWLTQLGLSVALPLAGFVLLGVWLYNSFHWGVWIIIACTAVGLICAADGLRSSLKAMERMAKNEAEEKPPVSFNEHD